jgi:hypothetical protein
VSADIAIGGIVADLPVLVATREALRSVACYVVAPARRAETGRIGLRPADGGFGTPPFADGTSVRVLGDELIRRDGDRALLTTLADAARFVGVTLTADPGVGHDLPELTPEADLDVDRDASRSLGRWWAFGQQVLDRVTDDARLEVTEAQLWTEHFDLAVVVGIPNADDEPVRANVGVSPGDAGDPEPYLYVGPHDLTGLTGPYWNRPWGAAITCTELATAAEPLAAATDFVQQGLSRLRP